MRIETVAIGNDHGGYELKQKITAHLEEKGIDVVDVGSHSTEIVRYPYFAARVSVRVLSGDVPRGILICSTGVGMSIAANKFKGIRASLCTSSYLAKMTRAHNDSNVLCLGGKVTGELEAMDIVDTWLETEYQDGRHDISLGLISDAEKEMSTGRLWKPEGPMK